MPFFVHAADPYTGHTRLSHAKVVLRRHAVLFMLVVLFVVSAVIVPICATVKPLAICSFIKSE